MSTLFNENLKFLKKTLVKEMTDIKANFLARQKENDTKYGDGLVALTALLPEIKDLDEAIMLKRKLVGNQFNVPPIVSWPGAGVCGEEVKYTIRVETFSLRKSEVFSQSKGETKALPTVVVGRGAVNEHFYAHKGVLVAGNDLYGPIPELGRLAEKLGDLNCPPFSSKDVDEFVNTTKSLLKP